MWAHKIRAVSVSPYPEGQGGGGGEGLRESAAKDIFLAGGRSLNRTKLARSVSELGHHRTSADYAQDDKDARQHPHPPRPENPPKGRGGGKASKKGQEGGGRKDVRIKASASALPAAPRGGGERVSSLQKVRGRVPTPAVKGSGDEVAPDMDMSAVVDGGGQGALEGRTETHSHSFVGFTKPNKFGRSWGEFNPRNEAIVRGVNPRQKLLESYGRSACPERTKDNFAQLIDRRSGQLAFRDRTGTLHSMLSITAADPYHKNTKTTSPFAVGRFEDAREEGVDHGTPQPKKKADQPGDTEKRTKKLWGQGTMKVHIPLMDHVNEGADRDAGGVTHNASAGGLGLQVANSTQGLARDMFERLREKPQTVLQIYKAGHEVRYKAIKRQDLPGGVFTQTVPDWYHKWNGGDFDMKDCSKYAMHHKHFGGYIPIKVLQHEYRPVSLTNYS